MKITYKEACEEIEKAKILTKHDGAHPTSKEIFNYSSTGELWMISEWYKIDNMNVINYIHKYG